MGASCNCYYDSFVIFRWILERNNLDFSTFRFISSMAVGFILIGGYRITSKVLESKLYLFLLALGFVGSYFFKSVVALPILMLMGGLIKLSINNKTDLWNFVNIKPPWKYLILFLFFAIASFGISRVFKNRLLYLFSSFYNYGYLVIGGGQVVIPLMIRDLVEVNHFMTNQEFLTGFGLVQGLPGPMFSFAAYAGAMAMRGDSIFTQILGGIIGGVGIFLPGVLLIYFVYPIWENIKNIKGIKTLLKGIIPVAGGMILSTGVSLFISNGFSIENILISIATCILLISKKLSPPLIVLGVLILGFIL